MAVAQFHDPLVLQALPPKRFKLRLSFAYRTLALEKPTVITARKGFITDLASIPQIFHTLLHKLTGMRAAVIHDWLYTTAADHTYTRAQCDRIFLEALKVAGVSWHKRVAMYAAVRVGGKWSFKKRRDLDV